MSDLLKLNATIDIQAAADKDSTPRIRINAYNGDLMPTSGIGLVVVDVQGMETPDVIPLLGDHENHLESVAGSGKPIKTNNRLVVEGTLSRSSPTGQRIIGLSKDNVPLQASIGAEILSSQRMAPGEAVEVNGRAVTSEQPFLLVSKSRLREVSIVAMGADNTTSVSIAAHHKDDPSMSTDIEAHRKLVAAEEARIDGIRASYQQYATDVELNTDYLNEIGVKGIRTPGGLKAHAIECGWDADKFELELRRAEKPSVGRTIGIHTAPPIDDSAIECAAMLHIGGNVEKHYQPQTIEAARHLGVRHFLDLAKISLQSAGMFKTSDSPTRMLTAAFSTTNLTDALSNLQNKSAAEAYLMFPSVARTVGAKLSASDFKLNTGVQLDQTASLFEEVGAQGEIRHGSLTDRTYTYQVSTYAKMLSRIGQNQPLEIGLVPAN